MISEQQKSRACRFARAALHRRYEEAQIERIAWRMYANFAAIEPYVPQLKAPSAKMTIKIGPDVVVFYRSLPEELSQDDKLELVRLFVDEWMKGQFERPIARLVFGNRFLHLLYRRLWIFTANWHDEPDGWLYEFIPSDEELFYGMNATRCGLVTFLQKQGLPELAPIICQGDHQAQPYLPEGTTFERTQVLAEGAPYCDFRYIETA